MQTFWKIIRAVIVLASAIGTLLKRPHMPVGLHSQWLMPLATLLAFPACVAIGLAILFAARGPKLKFITPSWKSNPFDFSHPEQFLHLAAFVLMVQGAVLLVQQFWAGSGVGAGAVAVFSTGYGVWLGLRILVRASRWQSQNSS